MALHRRGVKVRVITDDDQVCLSTYLALSAQDLACSLCTTPDDLRGCALSCVWLLSALKRASAAVGTGMFAKPHLHILSPFCFFGPPPSPPHVGSIAGLGH